MDFCLVDNGFNKLRATNLCKDKALRTVSVHYFSVMSESFLGTCGNLRSKFSLKNARQCPVNTGRFHILIELDLFCPAAAQ